MSSENLQIDQNTKNVLGAITNDANEFIKNLRVNPATGRLLVDAHVTSTNTSIGDTIPGGTAGSVLFLGLGSTLAQDNAHFFYDDTNHFLGLGTTTPDSNLHVVGTFHYVDGNESAGFVLTSDASGNATWQASTTGGLGDPGSNGVVVRTALDITVARTLTGTTNRLTINNGTGVAGNPTFDISSSYVGQATITTLGTITTGVWNGTKIDLTAYVTGTLPIANGGTGATTANTAFNALAPSQATNSGKFLTTNGTDTSWATVSSGGTGTVTSVAVATANGFLGTVANPSTTPAITIETSQTGIITGNGTAIAGTAFAQGDIFYGSGANTMAVLNKDTNATRYLSNTGTTNNPAWAQVNMANGVTGILPVANGGTGANTLAAHGVLIGNTTSAVSVTGAGTAGQVLTSNGASADPTFQAVPASTVTYSTGVGVHTASSGSFNITHGLGATPRVIVFNVLGGVVSAPDVSNGTYISGTQQCSYIDNTGPQSDTSNIYHINNGSNASSGQVTAVGGTTFTVSTGPDALTYSYTWQCFA